ncbi:MAG TPA: HAD hydrolase-like protein [Kofleriaceae bacterium]|nr:HAD hydrolase-like protein [Kofleriaceae bacterium]
MTRGALARTRAIVFDLDGTLVDSLPDIAHHLTAAMADEGLPPPALDDVRAWVGRGARQLVESAVGRDAAPRVLDRFRARYQASPFGRTVLFPGIAEMLDAVTRRHALAVLSNKPHDLVVAIVDALLARWRFRAVAGEQPGRPRKPDAGAILPVVSELGVSPQDCVLVGDSEIDLQTARAAAMPSVIVGWGMRDADQLLADHVVRTPAELADLFA